MEARHGTRKKEASFNQNKKVWHNLNFKLMIREMMIVIIVENMGITLNIAIKGNIMSPYKETKGIMEIVLQRHINQ